MKEKVCGVTGHRETPLNIWNRQSKVCCAKLKKPSQTAIPTLFPVLLTVQISYLPGLFWKKAKEKSGIAPGGSDSVPQPL